MIKVVKTDKNAKAALFLIIFSTCHLHFKTTTHSIESAFGFVKSKNVHRVLRARVCDGPGLLRQTLRDAAYNDRKGARLVVCETMFEECLAYWVDLFASCVRSHVRSVGLYDYFLQRKGSVFDGSSQTSTVFF